MAKAAVNWNSVSMLTPGMKNLGNQFNARWPNRDGASDGAIGDYKHSQGTSGHNPDDTSHHNAEWDGDSDNAPEIRAIDVDNNLGGDVSMQEVINHMRTLPNLGSVIRYMIYNEKIYRSSNDFEPEDYNGPSPHKEHAHFSGAYSQSADNNRTFDFQFEKLGEQDMPLTNDDVSKIWNAEGGPEGSRYTAFQALVQARQAAQNADAKAKAIGDAVALIASKVDLDPSEVNAIKDALAVPTAQENAEAVVEALGGVDMGTLAETLRGVLSDSQVAELVAELS